MKKLKRNLYEHQLRWYSFVRCMAYEKLVNNSMIVMMTVLKEVERGKKKGHTVYEN